MTTAIAAQRELGKFSRAVPEDRRMRFRIGVHLGDLLEKAGGTVYGDGLNIAASLQPLAEPGGIIASDAVHGAVRGRGNEEFVDQGEQRVKNIGHPPRTFKAARAANGKWRRVDSVCGSSALA